jgi:hypothetical protein
MLRNAKKRLFSAASDPVKLQFSIVQLIAALVTVLIALSSLFSNYGLLITFSFLLIIGFALILPQVVAIIANLERRYGLPPQKSYVLSNCTQEWHVNLAGDRRARASRTLLFYKTPQTTDLIDTVIGSLELSWPEINYETNTSIVDHYERSSPDYYNVHWLPKEPIFIGDSYTHEFSVNYPPGDQAFEKSFTIGCITPCRIFQLIITTDRIIKDVEIVRTYGEEKLDDGVAIFAKREWSLNEILKVWTQNRLTIQIENLEVGERYILKVFLETD